jgi:hypothetical protein
MDPKVQYMVLPNILWNNFDYSDVYLRKIFYSSIKILFSVKVVGESGIAFQPGTPKISKLVRFCIPKIYFSVVLERRVEKVS